MRSTVLFPGLLLALAVAGPASADTIHLASGQSIADVTIVEEGLAQISYKEGNRERQVPTDGVLAIDYTEQPAQLIEAAAYLSDGDVEGAAVVLDDYVGGVLAGNAERRHKWAPAHAAWRVVELRKSLGDLEGAAAAATRVIEQFADTRYLPGAFLAKADVLHSAGNGKGAQTTLQDFRTLIGERALGDRWNLECDLALVLTDDSLAGSARRDRLANLITEARSFATVRNRARVARGESFILEIAGAPNAAALLSQARAEFDAVIEDPKAADETLAGAYTGLGDCLFHGSAASADQEGLRSALLSYLRVPAIFSEQSRYVPKAMFYAGRCFDLLEDEESAERAQLLYNQVRYLYPDSKWAREARNFRR